MLANPQAQICLEPVHLVAMVISFLFNKLWPVYFSM